MDSVLIHCSNAMFTLGCPEMTQTLPYLRLNLQVFHALPQMSGKSNANRCPQAIYGMEIGTVPTEVVSIDHPPLR